MENFIFCAVLVFLFHLEHSHLLFYYDFNFQMSFVRIKKEKRSPWLVQFGKFSTTSFSRNFLSYLKDPALNIVTSEYDQHVRFRIQNSKSMFLIPYHITQLVPLDETHLDAVRGLILLRGFRPAHQQVELVRAMRLRSTGTNKSVSCFFQGLDSMLKNLDQSSLLIFSIFS